jgi:hypothetical protein
MSSRLSIPAVSSGTVANISTYLQNNDTTSFVNIFGDSDWSIIENIAYYKTLPVFSGTKFSSTNGSHNDINLLGKNDSMIVKVGGDKASSSTSGIVQGYVYIYNFSSFIVICFGDDFTNYKNAKFTGVTPFSSIVLIDKTNSELFVTNSNTYYNEDATNYLYRNFLHPSTFIGGLPAIKFGGAEPIYTNTVLMDGDADYYHQSWSMTSKRTVDSENAVFYKQLFTDGTETSRMYFFTSFPAGSTFETLHIDNKYYFILPYPETQTVRNATGSLMEGWCALGIDVTDDMTE